MTPEVSFIIPHKGREEFLIQTIDSIITQNCNSISYEVLVITQNESLPELSTTVKQQSNIKIFYQPEDITISGLRNYGVKEAQGEFLAFLDADVFLSNDWLTCMKETLLEDNNRVLVSASQKNSTNAPPLEKIRTALSNAELDCNVNFLPGRNLFLARSTFEQVKGFPEHLITCEDYYFTDQVSNIGELYYTSKANYVHLGEDKIYKEMYKKEIWRGQSNLQSIRGRKIPLREIPSFIIPISLAILLLLSLIMALIGQNDFAALCVALSFIPIFVYSLRLNNMVKNEVSFWHVLKFYLTYFPARAFGTIGGLFKSISSSGLK